MQDAGMQDWGPRRGMGNLPRIFGILEKLELLLHWCGVAGCRRELVTKTVGIDRAIYYSASGERARKKHSLLNHACSDI